MKHTAYFSWRFTLNYPVNMEIGKNKCENGINIFFDIYNAFIRDRNTQKKKRLGSESVTCTGFNCVIFYNQCSNLQKK